MTRAVLAFFGSSQKALEAQKRLKAAGFDAEQVDQVHRYPGDGTQNLMNPTQGRFRSLAELSLGADVDITENPGPLMAADPSASGFAIPLAEELPGATGFMVTTLVETDQAADEVAKIVEEMGGYV